MRDALTLQRIETEAAVLLGRYDRHRKADYAEPAAGLVSRLPEDPYVLAVFLEDTFSCELTLDLVRVVEEIWPRWLQLHDQAIREWACACPVAPLAVGTLVRALDPGAESGAIKAFDAERSRYQVTFAPGDRLLNHEDAIPA
jgi:hypothetical protein